MLYCSFKDHHIEAYLSTALTIPGVSGGEAGRGRDQGPLQGQIFIFRGLF